MSGRYHSAHAPRLQRVQDYEFDTQRDSLGRGVYGEVFRATRVPREDSVVNDDEEREVVAVKRTEYCRSEGFQTSVLREAMLLKEITKCMKTPSGDDEVAMHGGRNLLQLYDVATDNNYVHIIMEFCDGGNLMSFLRQQPGRRITDPRQYRAMVRDLVRGVCFLHRKEISHRDLKPENILLKKVPAHLRKADGTAVGPAGQQPDPPQAFVLKLADLGLSRMEGVPVKKYQHNAVTLCYRSPDIILGNANYRLTADLWSVACIIAEVATGSVLFPGQNEVDQLKLIFDRLGPPTPSNFPSMEEYAHHQRYGDALRDFMDKLHQKYDRMRGNNASDTVRENLSRYFRKHGALDVVGVDGVDLLARLLAYEPQQRMTAEEALQHPFFTTVPAFGPQSVANETR